jgi:hypothetical protein
LIGSVRKVRAMLKNWSSGADRLANAARAAGFAMATPDDRPDESVASRPQAAQPVAAAWTPASPQRALVVVVPRAPSYQSMFRDWVASLSWRAPA